jgi:hypothetical protein
MLIIRRASRRYPQPRLVALSCSFGEQHRIYTALTGAADLSHFFFEFSPHLRYNG